MAKSKYSPEFRTKIAQEYIESKNTCRELAQMNGICVTTVRAWVAAYRMHGSKAFNTIEGNRSYTKEFKLNCVVDVLEGNGSIHDISAIKNISPSMLQRWIKMYNANIELRDYSPKREVYMAEARRKTTIEERIEIVNYCINNNRNYKDTAALYDVSYNQVFSWVKKYDANGEEALTDKRGRRKADNELDELERLRRENLRLKRQLEEKDMLTELLKKVNELEGM